MSKDSNITIRIKGSKKEKLKAICGDLSITFTEILESRINDLVRMHNKIKR